VLASATFEQEILAASDAEIVEAAKELGMKPDMKGSAAFRGYLPKRAKGSGFLCISFGIRFATRHLRFREKPAI